MYICAKTAGYADIGYGIGATICPYTGPDGTAPIRCFLTEKSIPVSMERICYVAGIAAPLIFTTLWIAAMIADTDWVLFVNTLSDLGDSGVVAAELCFNSGCAVSGGLGIMFAVGVAKAECRFRYCVWTLLPGSFALIGIGIMNLYYQYPHYTMTTIYFGLMALSMIYAAYLDHKDGIKPFAAFHIYMIAFCAVVMIVLDFAVYEPIIIGAVMVWIFVAGVRMTVMYKKTHPAPGTA